MSQISIEQTHSLQPEAVRAAVDTLAEKLRSRFGANTQWADESLQFEGGGVEGEIRLLPGRVHVVAELGMIYGLMKGPIESEIRRVLQEQLGA
jgi:putative polyhydroxyalkanoate system protein